MSVIDKIIDHYNGFDDLEDKWENSKGIEYFKTSSLEINEVLHISETKFTVRSKYVSTNIKDIMEYIKDKEKIILIDERTSNNSNYAMFCFVYEDKVINMLYKSGSVQDKTTKNNVKYVNILLTLGPDESMVTRS